MISTIKAFADICKKEPIALGRQMENNYRQIIFDCSGFSEPITDITLVHQRSQDTAPYIVASTTESPLVWTIDSGDTAYYGYGKGELRISFANGLAKSASFQTLVVKSITADTEIPEPLQSWYDQMIDYINEHSITDDQLAQAIADYIAEHPITAPVQSVNSMTGDVVITAASLGALTSESDPVFQASPAAGITAQDITDWNNKSDFSGSYTDLTNKPTIPAAGLPTGGSTGQVLSKSSNADYAVQWSTVSGGGAVDSVNGQTGTVVLDASDVGALPDTYTAPVSSVNTRTGAVTVAEIFWCVYGTTTSSEIEAAIAAGKLPMVTYQDYTYTLRYRNSATNHRFICNYGGKEKTIACQSGTWIPGGDLTFLTTSYTAPVTSVNGRTGTVTGLAEEWTVQNMTASDTSVTLQTGKFYVFPTMDSLTITVTATGMYAFRFTSGATPTTLTVTGATMPDSFTVEANKVYEVNIYQGYGVVQSWS